MWYPRSGVVLGVIETPIGLQRVKCGKFPGVFFRQLPMRFLGPFHRLFFFPSTVSLAIFLTRCTSGFPLIVSQAFSIDRFPSDIHLTVSQAPSYDEKDSNCVPENADQAETLLRVSSQYC